MTLRTGSFVKVADYSSNDLDTDCTNVTLNIVFQSNDYFTLQIKQRIREFNNFSYNNHFARVTLLYGFN